MRGIALAVLLGALLEVEALIPRQENSTTSLVLSASASNSTTLPDATTTVASVSVSGTSVANGTLSTGTLSLPTSPTVNGSAITSTAATSTPSAESTSANSTSAASSTWSESVALPAHTGLTGPGVAFNFTGMNLTYYYDNRLPPHKTCADVSGGDAWSLPIVKNPSACGASISQLKTDNVVALNVSWLNQDNMAQRPDLCGREVQIWAGGKKLPLPTLFLYEACAACATMPRADVSVGTYIAATGDKHCDRGTVGGFDVLVLDRKVKVNAASRTDAAAVAAMIVAAAVAAL